MFLLEKNKTLQALSQKKDMNLLRKEAKAFTHQWLKTLFLCEPKAPHLKLAWSLPKKYISDAVTRNRLKRWGREKLRKSSLRGLALMVFFKRDKAFYKNLKRKDFDYVFDCILEKISSKT